MTSVGWAYIFLVIIPLVCILLCCLRYFRAQFSHRRQNTGLDPLRTSRPMFIYSVTMQGEGGSSFYNAVNDYLRNTSRNQDETRQNDNGVISRQRHLNGNECDANQTFTSTQPPSYDDVISGKYDSSDPPPYSHVVEKSSKQ